MTSFESVAKSLESVLSDSLKYHSVTEEQFNEFEEYYLWDVLKGYRYGQAFCIKFGISKASPLYFFNSEKISREWIENNYLVENEEKTTTSDET